MLTPRHPPSVSTHETLSNAVLSSEDLNSEDWKQELLRSATRTQDLVEMNLITSQEASLLERISRDYKIRVTPYYARLIQNSPDCPIRKQALPDLGESDPALPGWATEWSQKIYGRPNPWHPDPIGDLTHQAAPRLTHRYEERALLHLSSMCAVYCRFCFRKSHLNDESRTLYEGGLDPAWAYLKAHPEIREVIFTGGDPLSLTDSMLERIFEKMDSLISIRMVRIHSRMAVTLPSRFTDSLMSLLARERNFKITLVSHFNHPRELTPTSCRKLNHLRRAGVTLLNQSVLMRGVNASTLVLKQLFQGLYENGVIPFYLHHPDWTPGTFQFRLPLEEGRSLMNELRGTVSGPALPDYILDIPGGTGKTSILGNHLRLVDQFRSESILGAVYQIDSPSTRSKTDQKSHFYLDLSPVSATRTATT